LLKVERDLPPGRVHQTKLQLRFHAPRKSGISLAEKFKRSVEFPEQAQVVGVLIKRILIIVPRRLVVGSRKSDVASEFAFPMLRVTDTNQLPYRPTIE
jgi:hypothetical protein